MTELDDVKHAAVLWLEQGVDFHRQNPSWRYYLWWKVQ